MFIFNNLPNKLIKMENLCGGQSDVGVPTFSFSLKEKTLFETDKLPGPFDRKPGSITNLRRSTVSCLLEVFRPEELNPE